MKCIPNRLELLNYAFLLCLENKSIAFKHPSQNGQGKWELR